MTAPLLLSASDISFEVLFVSAITGAIGILIAGLILRTIFNVNQHLRYQKAQTRLLLNIAEKMNKEDRDQTAQIRALNEIIGDANLSGQVPFLDVYNQ